MRLYRRPGPDPTPMQIVNRGWVRNNEGGEVGGSRELCYHATGSTGKQVETRSDVYYIARQGLI